MQSGPVPRGRVSRWVLGSSRTGSTGYFLGSILVQSTSEPSLVQLKPGKDKNNLSFRRDMTEVLLKAARKTPFNHPISII